MTDAARIAEESCECGHLKGIHCFCKDVPQGHCAVATCACECFRLLTNPARIAELAERPAYRDLLGINRIIITETERLMLFDHLAALTAEVERLSTSDHHAVSEYCSRCQEIKRDVAACDATLTNLRASRLRLAKALRECFESNEPLSQAAWDAAAEARRIVKEGGVDGR